MIHGEQCAIVGIGETAYSLHSGRSEFSLALEAIRKAIDDSGLQPKDIDGILKYSVDNNPEGEIARALGIPRLRFWGEVGNFGGAGCGVVAHAVSAVATGFARYVVVFRALNGRSGARYGRGQVTMRGGQGPAAFTEPFGLLVPGQVLALRARRHMYEFGTKPEHFGAIALACRKHATRNPRAISREPLTMEDYLTSRMIYDPLRLYDCCREADGAVALVITSVERARDLPNKPAHVIACAQCQPGTLEPSYTEYLSKYVAPDLFGQAGVTPADIDVAEIYDHFTPMVLCAIEDYGFCAKGEGGPFVEDGGIELGGRLPVNTSGGNLSEAYMQGMNHIVEAVRQMRGTSTAQVEDAELVLVDSATGVGSLVLRR